MKKFLLVFFLFSFLFLSQSISPRNVYAQQCAAAPDWTCDTAGAFYKCCDSSRPNCKPDPKNITTGNSCQPNCAGAGTVCTSSVGCCSNAGQCIYKGSSTASGTCRNLPQTGEDCSTDTLSKYYTGACSSAKDTCYKDSNSITGFSCQTCVAENSGNTCNPKANGGKGDCCNTTLSCKYSAGQAAYYCSGITPPVCHPNVGETCTVKSSTDTQGTCCDNTMLCQDQGNSTRKCVSLAGGNHQTLDQPCIGNYPNGLASNCEAQTRQGSGLLCKYTDKQGNGICKAFADACTQNGGTCGILPYGSACTLPIDQGTCCSSNSTCYQPNANSLGTCKPIVNICKNIGVQCQQDTCSQLNSDHPNYLQGDCCGSNVCALDPKTKVTICTDPKTLCIKSGSTCDPSTGANCCDNTIGPQGNPDLRKNCCSTTDICQTKTQGVGSCYTPPSQKKDFVFPQATFPPIDWCKNGNCNTALGDWPYLIGPFIEKLFAVVLSLGGGIALLVFIYAGYIFMTSQGVPDKIQLGKELMTAAVVGLLFTIFAFVILQTIGVDILRIPGFSK